MSSAEEGFCRPNSSLGKDLYEFFVLRGLQKIALKPGFGVFALMNEILEFSFSVSELY